MTAQSSTTQSKVGLFKPKQHYSNQSSTVQAKAALLISKQPSSHRGILTIKLALHGWNDKGNSLGSTGGGWDNVQSCCSGTTQVTVGGIQQPLVSCVGVGGGHRSLDNAELVFQHLQEQ